MHSSCEHNEYLGIRNRVLGVVPTPTAQGLQAVKKQLRLMLSFMPRKASVPDDLERMPMSYSGGKRLRYLRGLEVVTSHPYSSTESRVKAFVKLDKMDNAKKQPDPRLIQFRSPEYCVRLAAYLKPIERALYRLKLPGKGRVCGKNMNMLRRGQELWKKWQRFDDPVAVGLDCSRFDKHCGVELLSLEHWFYMELNKSVELRRLLKDQLHNKGRTFGGLKYAVHGNRMSGDMNTALGNCLLMIAMMLAAMRELGITRYDILDDGDDCCLLVERSEVAKLNRLHDVFLTYGHELTISKQVTCFEQLEWCHTRPVMRGDGCYSMVQDPKRFIGKTLVSPRLNNAGELAMKQLIGGYGYCQLAQGSGVPIQQTWAQTLLRWSGGAGKIEVLSPGEQYVLNLQGGLKACVVREVTMESRESFWRAWGYSLIDQEVIESELAGLDEPLCEHLELGPYFDAGWVKVAHPYATLGRVHTPSGNAD